MYVKICVYFYINRKEESLRMAVNYNSVLNTIFEQNRKDIKLGWRKLLNMELHKLYHLLDWLVTKWRPTVTMGTEPTEHTEEKRKVQTWGVCCTIKRNRTSPLVHAHYSKNSSAKFSSILCTVPTLHQVIITCFSNSTNLWQARDWGVTKTQNTSCRTGWKAWRRTFSKAYKSWSHDMTSDLICMATVWKVV
jgi:hypothetical protein